MLRAAIEVERRVCAVRRAARIRRRHSAVEFSLLRSISLRGEFSFVDDGIRIFKATAIGSLLIVAAAFLYRGGLSFVRSRTRAACSWRTSCLWC